MRKKRFFLVLFTALVIFGCSNSDVTNTADENTNDDNTLTIAQGADLQSFDTGDNRHTPSDVILRNMFNRLFKRDNPESMEIVPELVEDYEMVNENTWYFKLKEGVTFHNGDPLTAEDVEFTLNRVAKDDEVSENVYFGPVIDDVNVIDELEFEIKTNGPSPTLLTLLSKSGSDILPKSYIEEVGWEEFGENPVGSGPYKYVNWIKDDRVVLEENEEYFGGDITWNEVVIRSIPESSTRVSELLAGGVDMIMNVPPSEWDRVNDDEDLTIIKSPTSRVMTLIARTGENYITSDPKVREAIDLAINKEVLTNQILQGSGIPLRTRVVDASFGANPELQNTLVYDPERAKQLLEESDYSDSELELTLQSPQGRYLMDSEVAEMIANMLSEVGIKVNLQMMESSSLSNAYSSAENEELMLIGLGDPMMDASYSLNHFHSDDAIRLMDYSNSEVDELFDSANSNMDSDEREKQYQKIQEIIAEERPQILLYSEMANYGTNLSISLTPYINDEIRFNDIEKVN
ncbi:ABC transporter substrate-binding protein [Virgibacillus sp. NKC19-3]|uniref:ABC transporter substrate-binding protein n=1 Tax=Virgibacillus saliphilus TaxID=2831674 RepID=UPI001C9A2FCE|nr:ABC transporter substrate-binding protein [Virgibacillus sp. NKC19-3]MBY7144584.1 ABC transporter substrate-binding protein [Virgibacillus sp. NKC19-3]